MSVPLPNGNGGQPLTTTPKRRFFRRGPWENAATAIIALGVFMLMRSQMEGIKQRAEGAVVIEG